MNVQKNKRSHVISIILLFIITVSIFTAQASAQFYEDTFPYDETGLTGGCYIECNSSIGNIVIVIPASARNNSLSFTTNGNLINITGSTIYAAVYKGGVKYEARFPSFSGLEYRVNTSSSYYDYVDVTTSVINDTNVEFMTASEYINDNYYFTKYEIASLSVQIAILFFVFLGWFLLHKR